MLNPVGHQKYHIQARRCLVESPTTRRAGGLFFPALCGKKQRHDSALIGAGVTGRTAPGLKTPNYKNNESIVGIRFQKYRRGGKEYAEMGAE